VFLKELEAGGGDKEKSIKNEDAIAGAWCAKNRDKGEHTCTQFNGAGEYEME
jgi:hypothetical protein